MARTKGDGAHIGMNTVAITKDRTATHFDTEDKEKKRLVVGNAVTLRKSRAFWDHHNCPAGH
ncbi:MAG: hypothetical protein P8J43_04480 [Pirellulales bacterium]|nr:hypothetical protein [Pirellulales bacterium]